MHNLFVLTLAILCILMFVVSRPVKMGILIFAGFCIYEYHLPTSYGDCVIVLPLCFILSEASCLFHEIINHRKSVLFLVLVIGILYTLFSIIVPHNWGIGTNYLVKNIFCRYMLPFYAFLCIRQSRDLKIIYRISYAGILFMSFFAVMNLIFSQSVYVDWLLQGETVADYMEEAGRKYSDLERFRVQGTFHNPFDYGYYCIVSLLLFLYGYKTKNVSKRTLIVVLACSIFGIVFCGCRTVLLCAIIAIICFVYIQYEITKFMKYVLISILFGVVGIMYVPFLNELFLLSISTFDTGLNTDVEGSSIFMREYQFLAVLNYIQGYELVGRGVGFFSQELGFAGGTSTLVDKSLHGLEGTYLRTLLETGIIGTIFYFSIIFIVLIWALKKKNVDRSSSSFLLSLFSLFLSFGLMTGELRSAYITFLVSGFAVLSIIRNEKKVFVVNKM